MLRQALFAAIATGGLIAAPQLAGATAAVDLPGTAYLAVGSSGPQVGILQSDLSLLQDPAGPTDGIFGPRTLVAVKEFQRYTGLTADGVVDSATWAEIHSYLDDGFHATSGDLATTGADYGDVGTPVVQLQQDLLAAGEDPGPVNGVYDASTRSAVFAFEDAEALGRTAAVGSSLAQDLGSAASSSPGVGQGSAGGAAESSAGSAPSSAAGQPSAAGAGQSASASSIDGRPVLNVLQLTATAYGPSLQDNYPYGPVDYFGNPLVAGDVAVDPSVIPLNTWLWVTGYSSPFLPAGGFLAHAVDEGDAIKGMRIDLYIDQSESNVANFGIQGVKVYVLGN